MRIAKRWESGIKEMDSTSMIDMTFQLVAFFMIALNFNEGEQNERISLPGSVLARPAETPLPFPIIMHLTKEGTVIMGGDEIPLSSVKRYLQRETDALRMQKRETSEATVIIRGDRDARTGKVQELIKICQESKYEKFALRAREDTKEF
jgi:biopolymer transport protein ExbD